jgi:hypothetical protein
MELDVAAYRRVAEKWAIKDEDINPSAAAVLMLQMCSELERLQKADYEFQAKLADGITEAFLERRWIPVSERLPIERPGVAAEWCDRQERITLVTDGESVWQATFVISGDPAEQPTFHSPDYFVGFGDPTKVTHWMPLPEPPEAK